jgi:hypothetical protein
MNGNFASRAYASYAAAAARLSILSGPSRPL